MGNMSYCRFHNTNIALNECLNVLEEPEDETMSLEEKKAAKEMFNRFLGFCVENSIIEEYDTDFIDKYIESFPVI